MRGVTPRNAAVAAAEVEPRPVRKIKGILPNGSWFHAPARGTGLALGALGRGPSR